MIILVELVVLVELRELKWLTPAQLQLRAIIHERITLNPAGQRTLRLVDKRHGGAAPFYAPPASHKLVPCNKTQAGALHLIVNSLNIYTLEDASHLSHSGIHRFPAYD